LRRGEEKRDMVYMQKEWKPVDGKIPALSIQQPYASAIVRFQVKDLELRTWKTAYRGVLAIHTGRECVGGLTGRYATREQIEIMLEAITRLGCPSQKLRDYPTGCIIGVARLVACETFRDKEHYKEVYHRHKSNAPLTPFTFAWHLADVIPLAEPIPTRGYLGLFGVDRAPLEEYVRRIEESMNV
jgi:hypothetical protein